MDHPGSSPPSRAIVSLMVSILLAGCYLPSREAPDQPVDESVRVTVTTCTSNTVGGGVRNDAEVPVQVQIRAKWLDATSTVYHEEQTQIDQLTPDEQIEWETTTDNDLDTPVFCEAEAQLVEALQ